MPDLFTLASDLLPRDIHVKGFKGREGISQLYGFEIGFTTEDGDFNQDDAVMGRATLNINLGDDVPPYRYHGIFAAVELLHEADGQYLYRAVLVPKTWQLTLMRHSNIWTDMTIPDVIKEVFEWSGFTSDDFELRLDGSYSDREFIAQYKETNFAFISRWMEFYGMFFSYEQGDSCEKLVIVDGSSHGEGHKPTIPYAPLSGDDESATEAFDVFRRRSNAVSKSVELLDYDYMNPTLDVRGASDVSDAGVGEVSYFGDDNFMTPGDGNKIAKLRAEEILARQQVVDSTGRAFHMVAGNAYTLDGHSKDDWNCDYLVTSVRHYGNQSTTNARFKRLLGIEWDKEYVVDVQAIPADVQYRPPDRHPWPRIEGYEGATVCGEADSEYAQLDDEGRYRIRFKFDESDLGDGKASCWVRMQQPYAGGNEGFHFPLIKKTEVLVFFLGGDPDRPIIAGAIPNAQTKSPVHIHNHTQNIIQTLNLNLIKIEDTVNQMFIFVQCPIMNTYFHFGVEVGGFNLVLNTEGHVHFNFGGDQVIDIQVSLTENVFDGDVTFNYHQNWIVNVDIDNNITIGGDMNIQVTGDVNYTFLADWNTLIIGDNNNIILCDQNNIILGDQNTLIAGDQNLIVCGDQNVMIGGDQNVTIGGDQNVDVGGDQNINIGGDQVINIGGKQDITVGADWKWNIGGHELEIKGANSTEITVGLKNEVFIGMKNELKLAVGIAITMGAYLEISTADKLALIGGTRIEIAGGTGINIGGGTRVELFAGLKIEGVAGAKIEITGAPYIELPPIEIHI